MVQSERVLERLVAPPRAVLERLTPALAAPSRAVLDRLTPALPVRYEHEAFMPLDDVTRCEAVMQAAGLSLER